jgi:hypothetical protein
MTDIAGLCERLRAITTTDHERLCQGREYACSCGWDAENEAKATKAADTIERQAAEIERLRGALSFYAEPENWHGTYSVGHAPMNDDWDDDLQHPLYPDGKLGKRARAALTGEDK